MPPYVLSKAAEADLIKIWKYTQNIWSEKQADKYFDELHAVCSTLKEGPLLTKTMPHVNAELRYCHHGRHFIFWLDQPTPLVIAFLHDRMDVVRHLVDRLGDK